MTLLASPVYRPLSYLLPTLPISLSAYLIVYHRYLLIYGLPRYVVSYS